MEYTEMLLEPRFVAMSKALLGSTASDVGCVPAAKGEPLMAESAPLFASSVNPRIWLTEVSATYRNLEPGSTTTHDGVVPAGNGEPVMALNAPLELMEKPETVCNDGLATYKNFPFPEIAIETGLAGVPTGEPRDFRVPSLPSTVKPEML